MKGSGFFRERILVALWQNCKFRDGFGNLVLVALLYRVVDDVLTIPPVSVEVLRVRRWYSRTGAICCVGFWLAENSLLKVDLK